MSLRVSQFSGFDNRARPANRIFIDTIAVPENRFKITAGNKNKKFHV